MQRIEDLKEKESKAKIDFREGFELVRESENLRYEREKKLIWLKVGDSAEQEARATLPLPRVVQKLLGDTSGVILEMRQGIIPVEDGLTPKEVKQQAYHVAKERYVAAFVRRMRDAAQVTREI